MKKLSLILSLATMLSCSKSLVYSPSVNLPHQPLKEKEIDLQGGIGWFPETRPEELSGKQSTLGLDGQIGYGFSDRFNLSIKGWVDVEGRESLIRSGYSLNAQFIQEINSNSGIIILPRIGIALNGDEISGYGLAASALYQRNIRDGLSWYGGPGLLWGFRYLEKDRNQDGEEKLPMGIGILGNLGIAWQFVDGLRINCELNPVYQINTFDQNSQFIVSPSIGVGYTLRKRNK